MRCRSKSVVFERPLTPQPPYYARPYWCLVDTLLFYNRKGEVVWEQKIPEIKLENEWLKILGLERVTPDGYLAHFAPRPAQVVRRRGWGWLLRIEFWHDGAEAIWRQTFRQPDP